MKDKPCKKGAAVNIASRDTRVLKSFVEEVFELAGKRGTLSVTAKSPLDIPLTYETVIMPRGAQYDAGTNIFSWTPDSNQIGKHLVAIRATDGALSATVFFQVEVFKTGNNPSPSPGTEPNPDPNPEPGPEPDEKDHFKDLGGYDWAKDAINSLADQGIIKGTGPETFSPGKNITRADFAILLVRAFSLSGSGSDQFIDVKAEAYYAHELAIAKENGIVNGIGGNRFNPEGQITREDMMLMLVRALTKLGFEFEAASADTLTQFTDAAQISDYAKEAVATLAATQIIAGENGRINPKGNATRAEVAVTLERVLTQWKNAQQEQSETPQGAEDTKA